MTFSIDSFTILYIVLNTLLEFVITKITTNQQMNKNRM